MRTKLNAPKKTAAVGAIYTFRVHCSFSLTCWFDQSNVERAFERDGADLEPTGAALIALEKELRATLTAYPIRSFGECTDFDDGPVDVDEDSGTYGFDVFFLFDLDSPFHGSEVQRAEGTKSRSLSLSPSTLRSK